MSTNAPVEEASEAATVGGTFKTIKREYEGKPVILGIRPEHMIEGGNLAMEIELVEHMGPATLFHCQINDTEMVVKLPGWLDYKVGEKIDVGVNQDLICFFDSETENRIR